MKFNAIPTEQTTAITDLILGLLALACAAKILPGFTSQPWKVGLWTGAFLLLAVGGILGAVAHGFEWSEAEKRFIWSFLYLSLALLVALFAVGACVDKWGPSVAPYLLPTMLVIGLGFFGYTQAVEDGFQAFLAFIVYLAVALVLALGIYLHLGLRQLPGAWWMAAGILVALLAAVLQQVKSIHFHLIWEFDNNGVFHLVQMISTIFLAVGLSVGLRASATPPGAMVP